MQHTNTTITIDQLNISVPGITKQQGEVLVDKVSRGLQQSTANHSAVKGLKDVRDLQLQVTKQSGQSLDQLAHQIVTGLIRGMASGVGR